MGAICKNLREEQNYEQVLRKNKMEITGSLVETIKTAQLLWFGHIKGMTDKRLPCMNGSQKEETKTNLDTGYIAQTMRTRIEGQDLER